MSRNTARNPARPSAPSLPRWVAALPLAGMLVACSSFAQSGAATGKDVDDNRRAVIDFKSCAKPEYPHDELIAGHEGTVVMKFLVGTDGTVLSSRIEHTSGFPALDQAALDALNRCRFKPARKDGQAAQTWTDISYVWTTG
jgi:bla regulator protein BlaR1